MANSSSGYTLSHARPPTRQSARITLFFSFFLSFLFLVLIFLLNTAISHYPDLASVMSIRGYVCRCRRFRQAVKRREGEREENVSRQKKEKEIKSRRPSATLLLIDMKNAD
ncbi:unnamed protein product [Hymenolepis diminuta]|uniref:Transmembrane protein n=1 Tax=Hymenolepis diminuta TaxID=6216 RepID=A0A0R3SXT6_HYMDI|nr:unnamed protein product [Hymenolepis diminuta]